MDKKGELSFEQVLFAKSLETVVLCAELSGNKDDQVKYTQLAGKLKNKIEPAFWNEEKKALVHSRFDGVQKPLITRYPNMFAVFFNYLSPEKQQQIKQSVLLNDSIMKISTPNMRFYELEHNTWACMAVPMVKVCATPGVPVLSICWVNIALAFSRLKPDMRNL